MPISKEVKKEYISKMTDSIVAAEQDESLITYIDYIIIIAQAAHESAWGTKAPGNNLFGIKAGKNWRDAKLPCRLTRTHEEINGKIVIVDHWFRVYKSWKDSIVDYVQLIAKKERFQRAWLARDNPLEYYRELRLGGYCTDSKYESKCMAIYDVVKEMIDKDN